MHEIQKIELDDGSIVFCVVQNGRVAGFVNDSGEFLYDQIPIGIGSSVVEVNPQDIQFNPEALAFVLPYSVALHGERRSSNGRRSTD